MDFSKFFDSFFQNRKWAHFAHEGMYDLPANILFS